MGLTSWNGIFGYCCVGVALLLLLAIILHAAVSALRRRGSITVGEGLFLGVDYSHYDGYRQGLLGAFKETESMETLIRLDRQSPCRVPGRVKVKVNRRAYIRVKASKDRRRHWVEEDD
jgi:hypothetical protein